MQVGNELDSRFARHAKIDDRALWMPSPRLLERARRIGGFTCFKSSRRKRADQARAERRVIINDEDLHGCASGMMSVERVPAPALELISNCPPYRSATRRTRN